MKSSRIIGCGKPTLQGVLLCWAMDDQIWVCNNPWHSFTWGGQSTMRVTAVMMSSKWALAWCAWEQCTATGGIVNLVRSEALQLHYRLCIILRKNMSFFFFKVYRFTINNETQMVLCASWLAMQGYFCFSSPMSLFPSSLNFNLEEAKSHSSKASQQEITKWALLKH